MEDEYDDDDTSLTATLGGLREALNDFRNPPTTPDAQEYAREILDRARLRSARRSGESELLTEMQRNAEATRQSLREAREKILARRYNPAEGWLAAAAAFGAPTRTGAFGETLGNVAGSLVDPLRRKQTFEVERDRDVLGIDQALSGVDNSLLMNKFQLQKMQEELEARREIEALKLLGRPVKGEQVSAKGREAVDRAYAKDYVDFIQGGAASTAKGLADLREVMDALGTGGDLLTGRVVGLIPKMARDVIPGLEQSGNIQDLVEYTVQQSLRPILGAQFTEKEGERMIARVYNPRQSEEVNLARLRRLVEMTERAYQQKIGAAKYFEEHGTLSGFQGKTQWTFDDFWFPIRGSGGAGNHEIEEGSDEEGYPDYNPADYEPAIDPNAPAPKGTAENPWTWEEIQRGDHLKGKEKKEEKPKKKFKMPFSDMRFAEGGPVEEEGEELADFTMPDGVVIQAPAHLPKAEVVARYEGKATPMELPVEPPDDTSLLDYAKVVGGTVGAGGLGALAAKYGVKSAHGLHDLIPGGGITPAEKDLLRLLESENLLPADWLGSVRQARRRGVPAMPVDVGGPAISSLAGTSLTSKNPQTRSFLNELESRQAGSRGRVKEQINQAFMPDDFFEREEALRTRRSAESSPLYKEAYEAFPYVKSEQLDRLRKTPSGKLAFQNAAKAILDTPGNTLGKADATKMMKQPSLEFLDQVKRQFDDMIINEEGSGLTYKATARGRQLRALRDALVNEMDAATVLPGTGRSPYAEARKAWETNSKTLEALRLGREDFAKLEPQELADALATMSFEDRDAFRTGVAQHFSEIINRPTTDINAAAKVIGSPALDEKLSLIFDNPNQYRVFKEALELEQKIFDDSKDLIRRGRRARAGAAAGERNLIQKVAEKAPTLGILSPIRWAHRLIKSVPEVDEKQAEEIIKMLRTGDEAALTKLEKRLSSRFKRVAKRKGRVGRAMTAGAVLGAAAPWVDELFPDDEEEETSAPEEEPPREYARGGLVRSRRLFTATHASGDGLSARLQRLSSRYEV